MNRFRNIKRAFSALFTFLLMHLAVIGSADTVSDQGRAIQSYGESLVPHTAPTMSSDGKSVQIGSDAGSAVSLDSLFPGSSSDPQNSLQSLTDGVNDPDTLKSTANATKTELYDDSNQSSPSRMGNIYGIARSTLAAPNSVTSADSFLSRTVSTFDNIDQLAQSLGNCSSSLTFSDTQSVTHLPELHSCQLLYNPVGSCSIEHSVAIESYTMSATISAQGRYKTDATISFKTGATTYQTDGSNLSISFAKADYDKICQQGKSIDVRYLGANPLTNISGLQPLGTNSGFSRGFFYGRADTTFQAGVLPGGMPTCANGLTAKLFVHDFGTDTTDYSWYMAASFSFQVFSKGISTWLPQDCIDKIHELDNGYCQGSIQDNTVYSTGSGNLPKPLSTDVCILEPGLRVDGSGCPNLIYDDQKVDIDGDKFVWTWNDKTSLTGMTCTPVVDGGHIRDWANNYICTNTNVGFKFSDRGPISGLKCLNINEEADRIWRDNYLCWDPASGYDFKWSSYLPPRDVPTNHTLHVKEPGDIRQWQDNYIGVIPPLPQRKCTTFGGFQLCENDPVASLIGSPSPRINHLAKQVDVNLNKCGPFNPDANTDSCRTFRTRPECKTINTECSNRRSDGVCIVQNVTYDCGKDVNVSDVSSTETTACTGVVRCMGTDCIEPKKTESASFNQVAAKLQAAQFMTQDMSCLTASGANSTDPSSCKVFSGKPLNCKTAFGGVQDCCDLPTNLTPGAYIQGLLAMGKLDSSLMSLQNGNAVKGAYQLVREPIAKTFSTVTKPFSSYIENISSAAKEFVKPVTEFVDQIKQQIKDAIQDIVKDLFKDTAKDLGADAAGSGVAEQAADQAAEKASEQVLQNIAGAANVIMAVYTAYVVATMVIQAAFPCEPPEFELAAKKSVAACKEVGSFCAKEVASICIEKKKTFCCYNSPLSRIVNEQLLKQGNLQLGGFGTPEQPSCQGLTISQLSTVDWTQVDLSEWTALLTQNGLQPKASAMTMDSITGKGNNLNRIDGNRLDAGERTKQRFQDLNTDNIRNEAIFNTPVNVDGK